MLILMIAVMLTACAGDAAPTSTPETTPDAPTATVQTEPEPQDQPTEPAATEKPEATPEPTGLKTKIPQPTAVPTMDPGTAQPGDTGYPAVEIPDDEILAAAARYFGLEPGEEPEIRVETWDAVSWSNGSMGCPKEGYAYTAAEVPGYRIVLNYDGQKVSVHTDETGSQIKLAVNCAATPGELWHPREPGESVVTIPEPTQVPEGEWSDSGDRTKVWGTPGPIMTAAVETARTSADSMASAAATAGQASAPPTGGQAGYVGHPLPPRHPRPPWTAKPDATFKAHARQPFVRTGDDPASTFSLDVDTTSYQLAVGWTRHGIRIDRDSVRAEEWVNALHYGYAPPKSDGEFAVTSGTSIPTRWAETAG